MFRLRIFHKTVESSGPVIRCHIPVIPVSVWGIICCFIITTGRTTMNIPSSAFCKDSSIIRWHISFYRKKRTFQIRRETFSPWLPMVAVFGTSWHCVQAVSEHFWKPRWVLPVSRGCVFESTIGTLIRSYSATQPGRSRGRRFPTLPPEGNSSVGMSCR